MFNNYYRLTKPGIIYGNLLTTTGGFLLASYGHIDFWLLLAILAGTSLVIASACVFNNYIDRGLDKKMTRTKDRALVNGLIPGRSALIYATVLGVAGVLVLGFYTNRLTLAIGLAAFFVYVVLYGVSKRQSVHGTLVGSIAGAAPPLAGYCAVTNRLDGAAIILFLILVTWQMAHFYAIAMYRLDDYAKAGLPVMPVKHGTQTTRLQILLYIGAFIVAVSSLSIFGFAGVTFAVVMAALGLAWLWRGLRGHAGGLDDKTWGRKMFLFSLIVILALSTMLSINAVLP